MTAGSPWTTDPHRSTGRVRWRQSQSSSTASDASGNVGGAAPAPDQAFCAIACEPVSKQANQLLSSSAPIITRFQFSGIRPISNTRWTNLVSTSTPEARVTSIAFLRSYSLPDS
jgi:hypothetical protein